MIRIKCSIVDVLVAVDAVALVFQAATMNFGLRQIVLHLLLLMAIGSHRQAKSRDSFQEVRQVIEKIDDYLTLMLRLVIRYLMANVAVREIRAAFVVV